MDQDDHDFRDNRGVTIRIVSFLCIYIKNIQYFPYRITIKPSRLLGNEIYADG